MALDIRQAIRDYLITNFLYTQPHRILGDTDNLLGTGVLDSMAVVEVVDFLQDAFGVTVTDAEVTEANLGTVDAMTAFVEART